MYIAPGVLKLLTERTIKVGSHHQGARAMIHRTETTDPISRRDVGDLAGKPYVVESSPVDQLTIYFETEENKRTYERIPVERPIDHHVNLDNPTDVHIDEG